jgi:DnaD/phage-associated family protein
VIRVVDRWIENFAKFSGLSVDEIIERVGIGSPSRGEGSPSRGEGKKELFKNLIDERFGAIAQKLAEVTGGGLNTATADLIDTWMEKHTDEWIYKAITMAKDNGANHQNYVDKILIGWEAKGYPKSRDEKVREQKGKKKGQTQDDKIAAILDGVEVING